MVSGYGCAPGTADSSSSVGGPKAADGWPSEEARRGGRSRFRLPKSHLLRKRREYDLVYREGCRYRGQGCVLVVRANGLSHSRLGISVHRRIRPSVRRNRIKRIIRESYRLHRHLYPARCDMVFVVRPDFGCAKMQEVSALVARLGRGRNHGTRSTPR